MRTSSFTPPSQTFRFADQNDDYFIHDADAALIAEELEDRDYYKEVNVFWVPEAARWESP